MANAYCNSPIIIKTQGFVPNDGEYFPRMVLVPNGETNNEMTAECGSGKEIRFDLSAYAKGKLYNMSISPDGSVPTTNINYSIYQRFFSAGSDTTSHRTEEDGTVTVFLGRGDAWARYNGTDTSDVSYKPNSVETVNQGDYYIPKGTTTSATLQVVSVTTSGVYIESNPLRHQIIFLNSFGRWESASACTRESKSYKYANKETELDGKFIDNVDKPTLVTNRQLNEVVWKMSSGYCTQEWADWWTNEVLAAEYVWLRENDKLVRVVLEPEDSVQVYNKSKGDLAHIDFNIKFI